MLFDLRGRGRRRTIQVIYLTLAILMGGGLVLFGIGGATSGGLVDAISGGGGGGGDNVFEERVDDAQKKVDLNARDAAAWAALSQARFQFAQAQETEADVRAQLTLADRAWQRYLGLDPDPVDEDAARTAVNLYAALNKPAEAVAAQEYVIEASGDEATYNQYVALYGYALAAGQQRKADLAYDKALELAPSADTRKQAKTSMDQTRTELQSAAAGTSTDPPSATGE